MFEKVENIRRHRVLSSSARVAVSRGHFAATTVIRNQLPALGVSEHGAGRAGVLRAADNGLNRAVAVLSQL